MRFHRPLPSVLPAYSAVLALCSCAHAPPASSTATSASAQAPEPASAQAAPAPVSRDFTRDALYRELVEALDAEKTLGPADAPCLLGRSASGFHFAGEASAALHPLPASTDDLDDRLRAGGSVRMLTRHGSFGPEGATLGFAALTQAVPTRAAVLIVVTDQAYYVRGLTEPSTLALDGAAQAAAEAKARGKGATLYVAGEGRVALANVYDLLAALSDFEGLVVLAAALPSDVVLPAPPAPSELAPRCADGLPETDALSGDLPVAELNAGMAPLRERVPDCLAQADGPAAAGDRLTLALRIDARGVVSDACLVSSEANDARLTSCVLALARELRFARPSPPGVVDVELPLTVRPHASTPQAAVCR